MDNKHRRKGRIEKKPVNLQVVTTKELVEELGKREGVLTLPVKPHETYEIHREQGSTEETGPAVVLVVED